MKLIVCAKLPLGPETGVWYRAIDGRFWETALQTIQTKTYPTRYNGGSGAERPFEVLYLAEDHEVALYEARAMHGPPFPASGATVLADPRRSWNLLNVQVRLQQVADLTLTKAQNALGTSAQELTGDWVGYQERRSRDSVNQPAGLAPTQLLGQALYDVPELEGFRTVSARRPSRMILVIFPGKLQPRSEVLFTDGMGKTHRIGPAPKGRRRPK